jgi:hypothetical protein
MLPEKIEAPRRFGVNPGCRSSRGFCYLWHRKGGARSGARSAARSAPLEILGVLRNSRSPFYVKDHSPPTTHPTHALRALCLALFALRAPHNAPMRYAPRITPMRYAPRKPLPRVERVSPLNVEDTSVHTISQLFRAISRAVSRCFACVLCVIRMSFRVIVSSTPRPMVEE